MGAPALAPKSPTPALPSAPPAGAGIQGALSNYQSDVGKIESNEATQLGKEEADFAKQGLTPPKLDLPPSPTVKSTNPQEQWGSAAMMLATLGSLMTRQPLTTALNAAAGVLTAYKKGDQDAANAAFQTWKVSTDNAIKVADFQQKAYEEALTGLEHREKMTMEQANMAERAATAQFRATATAFQDEVALKALEQRGLQGAQQLQIERQRLGMEMQGAQVKNIQGFAFMNAYQAMQKDPKFLHADPAEQLGMVGDLVAKVNPSAQKERFMIAQKLRQEVEKGPIGKSYSVVDTYMKTVDQMDEKLKAAGPISIFKNPLNAQEQGALVDGVVKIITGGNAVRGFQIKLNSEYAGLSDKAAMVLQKAKDGGPISAQMAKNMIDVAKDYSEGLRKEYDQALERSQAIAGEYGVSADDVTPFGAPNAGASAYAPAVGMLRADAKGTLEGLLGVPVQVTSAGRSAGHNAAVGGAPTSEHLSGDAWDFKPEGMDNKAAAKKLAEQLRAEGVPFDQIEVTPNHVHVGFGPKMRGEIIGGGGEHVASTKSGHKVGDIVHGPDGKKYKIVGGDMSDPDIEPAG